MSNVCSFVTPGCMVGWLAERDCCFFTANVELVEGISYHIS